MTPVKKEVQQYIECCDSLLDNGIAFTLEEQHFLLSYADQITNTVRVRTSSHCGNVEESVALANHQTLAPEKTDDMGLWTFMKENKRLWLLPIIIAVLFIGSLVVFAHQYQPSTDVHPMVLF